MRLSHWALKRPDNMASAVALHNSHHIGRIGYWAEQCAAGFISIHFVNVVGDPMVAPFGGKDSRFGTNPFCVVFPREGQSPLLLDYATSAIAFGKREWLTTKANRCPMAVSLMRRGSPLTIRRLSFAAGVTGDVCAT
jgi:uncharacterized oxidoreductase